jgi:hypothetical protein
MQQARARFQRESEPEDTQLDIELSTASALGYNTAASSRRHLVAIDGGAEAISRFETSEFDAEFFGSDDDVYAEPEPTSRRRPRRPTGAAADYARGYSGGRRTVRIGGPRPQTSLRPTPSELRGPRPDRVAGWAFAFAIFVAILAALTGGG